MSLQVDVLMCETPGSILLMEGPPAGMQPLEDPSAVVESTLAGLESSDWVEATRALNVLRQLAVHHPETISPYL